VRGFPAQARSATNAATAARRTPQEGLRATEVWVPDQNNALRFSGFRPEARLRATLGQDAPHGLGATGRMLFWVPDQNNALRFSGFQPEARLRATLGQDAPHGRGVSDPSPCAPPRQAGKPGPIGHRVVGFCGAAWGE